MPWGYYQGIDGVRKCYLEDHGDRNDPEIQNSPILKGGMMMHCMNTEIIEVSEDGQTAKAAFFSDGHETYIEGRVPGFYDPSVEPVPHAEWCWGAYAVDFIKDDGEWKIWHMRLYPISKSEYGESWVDAEQPAPDFGKDKGSWCWGKYEVDFIKEDGVWKFWHMTLFPLFLTPYNRSWGEPELKMTGNGGMPDMGDFCKPLEKPFWKYGPDAIYPDDEPAIPAPYAHHPDLSL